MNQQSYTALYFPGPLPFIPLMFLKSKNGALLHITFHL